jgi:hypothetical protein
MKSFSDQTIAALTEVLTGGSGYRTTPPIGHYRTGPALEQFLESLGIELSIGTDSRVPKVRAVLETENRKATGRDAIIKTLEAAADPRDYVDEPDKLRTVVEYLNKRLAHDGFTLRLVRNTYRVVSLGTNIVAATALKEKVETLSFDSVQRDFDQALSEADGNPPGAVTSACSTIESVCKSILDEMGVPYPAKQDIQHLSNSVANQLGLSPARTDLPPLLAQDLKQVFGGLQTIAGGVGALRTHFGDAHGKGKSAATVHPAIARLAIHAACTLSLFYIETWQRMLANQAEE